jgi:hypothetical protein
MSENSDTPIGDSVPGQPAQQPDPVTPEQVGAGAAEQPASSRPSSRAGARSAGQRAS